MENFIHFIPDWGPESLLALTTIMLLWGKLLAKPTVDRALAAKDSQISELKLYYEGRIRDIEKAHAERGADLRHIAEVEARALQTAVDNAQRLIQQNDELLNLARTAAPALLAARRAAEERNV